MKPITLPVVFCNYRVTFTPKYPKVDGIQVLGYCDYDARSIKVYYNKANIELVRATFWHEAFHAILRELGRGNLATDESLVDGLANAVMRIRLDHPKL